jgi:hypothetical protein
MGILAVLSNPDKAEAKKPADKSVEKPVDKTIGPKAIAPRTVLLLLRTATCLQSDEVIATLKRGLDVSKCGITGNLTVAQSSTTLMGLFDKKPNWTRPTASKCVEGLTITPAQDKENHLRFQLKNTKETIQELVVHYRKVGNRTYTPEVDGDLQLEAPGTYLLKLEAHDEPIRYTATVVLDAKKRTCAQPFPTWERCYVVIMPQFTGELTRLFAAVKDPAKVPNAFDDLREGPVVTMAMVDLDSAEIPLGDTWDKNDYIPAVSALAKRKAKRAWVRFPLTESEAANALAAFRKLTTRQLSQIIRKEAVMADANHRTVSPTSKPAWFEMPTSEAGSRFQCRIPIKDVKGLHKKYHKLYRLLVYEFDDGTAPEAILVSDHSGCCKSAVVMQEVNR